MERQRVARLAREMEAWGFDQVLVTDDLNLYYYMGGYEQSMERLRALLVDRQGGCRYYANALFAPAGAGTPCEVHRDGEEPQALRRLAGALPPGAVVGVDKAWPAGYALELASLAPGCTFRSAGALPGLPMACKDSRELELMRRSSQINDQVVGELIASIDGASTEEGLSQSIHALYDRHGAQGAGGGALVAFGANCASPHPQCRAVRPQKGDCILIDAGAPYRRYQSDMTRTVFYGDVPARMERVYAAVLEANLAGIDAVRPGRTAGQVDAACRQVLEKAGYGPYFTHRTGHGVGLHLHEEPAIGQGSQTVLREGMVFSVEPGVYLPGRGGVRIEDLVVVTAGGAEVLNRLPKTLQVIET